MRQGLAFILIFMLLSTTFPGEEVQSEEKYQTIPDEAIRLRILANSDSETDQQLKRLVRDDVNHYISDLVQDIDDIKEARDMIQKQLPEVDQVVADTLEREGVSDDYQLEYRSNVSFPTKVYDHYVYPSGEYEAVLITIGDGQGANWWCVLFPPLCFLDFSNGGSVAEDDKDMEEDPQSMEDTLLKSDESNEKDEEVEISFFLFEWLGLS